MKYIDFPWHEVTAIKYEWGLEGPCPQFVHDVGGFEKVIEESKGGFSNLVTLSKVLELDLQEDDFIELLLCNTRSRLMKT